MKIEQRSFLNTRMGLLGALWIAQSISAAWCIDGHITVLRRNDGTYSFKDHNGQDLSKAAREKIIKEIEK